MVGTELCICNASACREYEILGWRHPWRYYYNEISTGTIKSSKSGEGTRIPPIIKFNSTGYRPWKWDIDMGLFRTCSKSFVGALECIGCMESSCWNFPKCKRGQ
jgi:hypothetical protein